MILRAFTIALALAAASACSQPQAPAEPAAETPAAEAPATPSADDTCGAEAYRHLIGSNVAAVTLPADANVRIVMPGQPVTDDLRTDRVNLIADANGIITSVECY